jgi:hypothetical protein
MPNPLQDYINRLTQISRIAKPRPIKVVIHKDEPKWVYDDDVESEYNRGRPPIEVGTELKVEVTDPQHFGRWLLDYNVTIITSLELSLCPLDLKGELGPISDGRAWGIIFELLCQEGTEIETLYIDWDPSGEASWLGKDLDFIRGLAKVNVTQLVHFKGLYAKSWPRYVAEKLAVPVETPDANSSDQLEYQAGTEFLDP